MTTSQPPSRLPLALTMGEPAGIGGEIALKAWQTARAAGGPVFFALDDPLRLAALARQIGWDIPVTTIAAPEEAAGVFARALPVLPVKLPRSVAPGKPDPANAPAVIEAIRRAVELTQGGHAAAVVTNPIHKKVLYDAGFRHPGHTEYLGELTGVARPVMMLATGDFRVVPVTIHLSLRDALAALTTEAIVDRGRVTAEALKRDFGIAQPRLAVAGLNPHAGEEGALGREDIEIVAPAVAQLRALGIEAVGPLPSDTMFHGAARATYDTALCMYHDQALIPLKTLGFDQGVDITLGLPIVRTSPDHGTAFNIAGSGAASASSLIAALHMAAEMAARRAAN
jgi:4-hydroxythreonine-4-phosphate dehydrogenase